MFKRKAGDDLEDGNGTPTLPSIDPTRRQPKRLFRGTRTPNKPPRKPLPERAMPELLDFILQHEEAFKNEYRLASLYADFRQQLEINPEGYHANITAWTKALVDASRAGAIVTQGTTHDLLSIRTGDELLRALQHPQHGKPTCLPAVFHEAVQKKEMIPLKDFLQSKESIYKSSWIPTPWQVLTWGLRQVGVLGQPRSPDKLGVGNFVAVKNVEVASDEILKKMKEHTSTADRVLSRADFLNRFSKILNPTAPLTADDLNILLVHLSRDKQAISYNAQIIKFKSVAEAEPEPITQEDEAIANLRDTIANINAQIQPLMVRITESDAAAREAVAAKQMVRAKAALRSKKLAETTLAQRSDVVLQLEGVYAQLQQAADQVEIVEAMRAGADALKTLNEKVGGAEGVQGVVDAVNEQMATTEEITNMINESDQPLDEAEIDDEFEALEKAEKEKQDKIEAQKTAARLAELDEAEKKRKEQEALAEASKKKEEEEKSEKSEKEVEVAEKEMSRLSFQAKDDGEMETEDGGERRVLVPA